jgi:hypothetical protein
MALRQLYRWFGITAASSAPMPLKLKLAAAHTAVLTTRQTAAILNFTWCTRKSVSLFI